MFQRNYYNAADVAFTTSAINVIIVFIVRQGGVPEIAKPPSGLGLGVLELALRHRGEAYRVIHALQIGQDKLTVRKAQALTGIAAADFSRFRRVKLDRFTLDRLTGILSKLGQEVAV